MEVRDFVVLAYDAFSGEIKGKTKLQKRIYFLGVMLGKEAELGYVAHYYGPYSPQVADANAELTSLGFLEEQVSYYGATDREGFEVARYDYSLTEAGQRLAGRKKREHPEPADAMLKKAQAIEAAGDLNYMELSAAAKFYYVLRQQRRATTLGSIQEMASRLGWSLSDLELQNAKSFLQDLSLVSVS